MAWFISLTVRRGRYQINREPLTAGPGDWLFGALHFAFGDVGVVHSIPSCSGDAGPVRTAGDPWSAARSPGRLCY